MELNRAQNLLDLSSTQAVDDRTLSLRVYVQAALCMFPGELADSERLMMRVDPRVVSIAPAGVALAATYRGDLDRATELDRSSPSVTQRKSMAALHQRADRGRRCDWATAAFHYSAAIDEAAQQESASSLV